MSLGERGKCGKGFHSVEGKQIKTSASLHHINNYDRHACRSHIEVVSSHRKIPIIKLVNSFYSTFTFVYLHCYSMMIDESMHESMVSWDLIVCPQHAWHTKLHSMLID